MPRLLSVGHQDSCKAQRRGASAPSLRARSGRLKIAALRASVTQSGHSKAHLAGGLGELHGKGIGNPYLFMYVYVCMDE